MKFMFCTICKCDEPFSRKSGFKRYARGAAKDQLHAFNVCRSCGTVYPAPTFKRLAKAPKAAQATFAGF